MHKPFCPSASEVVLDIQTLKAGANCHLHICYYSNYTSCHIERDCCHSRLPRNQKSCPYCIRLSRGSPVYLIEQGGFQILHINILLNLTTGKCRMHPQCRFYVKLCVVVFKSQVWNNSMKSRPIHSIL